MFSPCDGNAVACVPVWYFMASVQDSAADVSGVDLTTASHQPLRVKWCMTCRWQQSCQENLRTSLWRRGRWDASLIEQCVGLGKGVLGKRMSWVT
ncbi:hypothetical protein FKM82_015608 [Ascaphus truei]